MPFSMKSSRRFVPPTRDRGFWLWRLWKPVLARFCDPESHLQPETGEHTRKHFVILKRLTLSELNDYRSVALTSHVMSSWPTWDHRWKISWPSAFACESNLEADDAFGSMAAQRGPLLLNVNAFVHLTPPSGCCCKRSCRKWQQTPSDGVWQAQHVRLKSLSSGAPQGTKLSPFLFTLSTSDFQHKST